MKKLWTWLSTVPHLYGKIIVAICIAGGSASIAWSFRILSRTDNDPTATLVAALGFFGGELMLMAGRDVFPKKTNKDKQEEN